MTTPTPETPTAADALRRAFAIVKDPCSAAETQRAEVLLGIAREIREEQQYRDTRSALTSFAGIDNRRAEPQPASGLRAGGIIAAPTDFAMTRPMARPRDAYSFSRQTEGGPAEPATVVPADGTTAYMPALAERTQSLPIVWSIGDKADCKHCHTPIEFTEATVKQQAYGEAEEGRFWRHKYTQQVVCATAPLGGEDEEVVHTFAAPSV
jgi:hypothetical protein